MSKKSRLDALLNVLLAQPSGSAPSGDESWSLPVFAESEVQPEKVDMTTVLHPDGRMSQYPPSDKWDDWVEWDGRVWPKRVARRYTLVPTTCFNC